MTTRAFQVPCRNSPSRQQRTTVQARPPVDLVSGRKLGGSGVTRSEAIQQQSIQYLEEKKKFDEKEKEKLDKKRAEKWKRYCHVDLGETLSNSSPSLDELKLIRQQQQLLYTTTVAESLKLEQERRESQQKLEDKRQEKKLKKYAQVASEQRLGDEQSTNMNQRTRANNAVHGMTRSTSKTTENHPEASENVAGPSHSNNFNVNKELNET